MGRACNKKKRNWVWYSEKLAGSIHCLSNSNNSLTKLASITIPVLQMGDGNSDW